MATFKIKEYDKENVCRLFGENLKYLLRSRHLKQLWLADKIGVGKSTVNLYCTGDRFPRADHLALIANIFGLHVQDFFDPECHANTESFNMVKTQIPVFSQSIGSTVSVNAHIASSSSGIADFALIVPDDSMAPALLKNDTVFCRNSSALRDGKLHVLELDGSRIIRTAFVSNDSVTFVARDSSVRPLVFQIDASPVCGFPLYAQHSLSDS